MWDVLETWMRYVVACGTLFQINVGLDTLVADVFNGKTSDGAGSEVDVRFTMLTDCITMPE